MMHTKSQLTNGWLWIVLIFIFLIFVTAINLIGVEFAQEGKLNDKSLLYVAKVNNIDVSEYTASREEVEDPVFFTVNQSGSNQKDFGLDISFAKEKANNLRTVLTIVFNIPEHLIKLLNLNMDSYKWFIDVIDWFFNLAVIFAVTYFVLRRT